MPTKYGAALPVVKNKTPFSLSEDMPPHGEPPLKSLEFTKSLFISLR